MSRCFPFPPPNYRKERDLNGDLRFAESIKKEQESLSKEKRKDRKRERKEKKDKSKDVGSEKSKHGQRSHKKPKLNDNDAPHNTVYLDSKAQLKKNLPLMKDGYNNDGAIEVIKNKLQIKDERSGITEELTLRVLTPEPCESSESTENSSKAGRKLEANNTNYSNSILRFKLPLQKPKDQKSALAAELPSTYYKTGPRIVEATQANEALCFTGRKTSKVQKNNSANEATNFVGRTTPEPKVLKASQGLPPKGATSFSAQPGAKTKGSSALPINEASRCSGRAIPRPKVDKPCFSGQAPPKPIALKSSPATEVAKISGRSLPEPKVLNATPVPGFSCRVNLKTDAIKAPPVSKADLKPKVVKALPVNKANCYSEHNLPKPKVVATQANEAPCFPAWPAPDILKASVAKGTPGVSIETCKTSAATAHNEAPCSSGHATKAHRTELESIERKSRRSRKHHERKYKELFLNWKPEPLIVREEADLSWLFSKSEKKQSKAKSEAPISDTKSCAVDDKVEKLKRLNPAYGFQPRAQYLPEVDVYALPYTVPF